MYGQKEHQLSHDKHKKNKRCALCFRLALMRGPCAGGEGEHAGYQQAVSEAGDGAQAHLQQDSTMQYMVSGGMQVCS